MKPLIIGGLVMDRPPLRTVTDRTKRLVRARDLRCVYCGDPDGPFHFDHRTARSKGGPNGPDNVVLACATCNLSKAGRDLEEWQRNG